MVRGVAAPFVAGLAIALLGRGRSHAPVWLAAALGLGLLTGWLWLEGLPHFPPPAAKAKLPYLIAAALGLALVGESLWARPAAPAVAGAGAVAALVWLAWRPLQAGPDGALLLRLALVAAGTLLVFEGTRRAAARDGALGAAIPLATTGAGLGGVALLGASATLGLFAGSVAAAAGGIATGLYAAQLVGRTTAGGASLAWVGAAALGGLVAVLALFTPKVSVAALAVLALGPWAGETLRGWAPGTGAAVRALRPVLLTLGCALPPLAAVGLAQLLEG